MYVKIPIQLLAIENDGFHLMVEVEINHKKANMIIDTGASRTVFDENLIGQFINVDENKFEENEHLSTGLGTNSMRSKVFELNSLKFGKLELKNYQAVVMDLKTINDSYRMLDLPTIHAVLGGDLLKKYKAVIFYKNKTVKLYY